jgi:ribose transport system ATP-binding protein
MVAVARALPDQDSGPSGILFLDEPTTGLPAGDVTVLVDALRRCAAAGQTIVFVSHRIDEVLDLADRVSVLRDGVRVATAESAALTEDDVVGLIAGRTLTHESTAPAGVPDGEPVLDVRRLAVPPLHGVDLRLYRGEILGIAGLLGSGRTELLQTVFGAQPAGAGQILLRGKALRLRGPGDAVAAGIGYVPEDRPGEAIFAPMSVRENISAGGLARYRQGRTPPGHPPADRTRLPAGHRPGPHPGSRFRKGERAMSTQTASVTETVDSPSRNSPLVAAWHVLSGTRPPCSCWPWCCSSASGRRPRWPTTARTTSGTSSAARWYSRSSHSARWCR